MGSYSIDRAEELYRSGQFQQAEKVCRQILIQDSKNVFAMHLLGLIAFKLGRLQHAIDIIQRSILLAPNQPTFYQNLGNILQSSGDLDESIVAYQKAVVIDPNSAEIHNDLGNAFRLQGQLDNAVISIQNSISIQPNCLAFYNLGLVMQDQENVDEAISYYKQAIAINPNFVQAYNNLGNIFQTLDKLDKALEYYKTAVRIDPDYLEVQSNLGTIYINNNELNEAINCYQHILRINPNSCEAENNLGIAYNHSHQMEMAISHYRRALQINPKYADAKNNLGFALQKQDEIDQAILCYEAALKINPNFRDAQKNLGLAELSKGNFIRGWYYYTARDGRDIDTVNSLKDANIELQGKRILLIGEQGLGEELFFLRFVPQLKRLGSWIAYQSGAKLKNLASRLPYIDYIADKKEGVEVDYTFLIGDLPRLLDMTSADKIPSLISFNIRHHEQEEMVRLLEKTGGPPYIGVSWWAGAKEDIILYRRVDFRLFAELFQGLEGTIINLQRDSSDSEIEALSEFLGRQVHDFSSYNADLEEMVILLGSLDYHITISNTNVHLRSAVNGTSFVLVPFYSQPKIWMGPNYKSLWYPNVHLYRQTLGLCWKDAIIQLKKDLFDALKCNHTCLTS